MRKMLIVLLLAVIPMEGMAQWDTASHIRRQPLGGFVAGTALVAGGSLFTFVPDMKSVAVDLRNAVQADNHKKLHFDDYIQYLPTAAPLSLKLLGLESQHEWKRMALLEGGSYLLGYIVLESAKHGFDVLRPDGRAYNSFPSGHSFMAFTGAEVVRREYGEEYPWIAVAGYMVAVLVAGMRVYNDRHWVGDIMAGAGLGVLSASTVYWVNEKLKVEN